MSAAGAAAAGGKMEDPTYGDHVPTTPEVDRLVRVFQINLSGAENITSACFEHVYSLARGEGWAQVVPHLQDVMTLVDAFGRSLLHRAIDDKEWELTKHLTRELRDFTIVDQNGDTALHRAACSNNLELIDELLRRIDIHVTNREGFTPLHVAIVERQTEAMERLIERGASITRKVNYQGIPNVSPLALVGLMGNQECFEILLKKVDFNTAKTQIGNFLHLLIHFHQNPLLEHVLTEHRSNCSPMLSDPNDEDYTPLALAAFLDNIEAVTLLHRARPEQIAGKNSEGRTPIHIAAKKGSMAMVEHLWRLGANIRAEDDHQKRPKALAPPAIKPLIALLMHQSASACNQAPQFHIRSPQNLVFKGGGPKGIAYIGALRVLQEAGALGEVYRVAGTSAGAINSALFAVGFTIDEIEHLLATTDLLSWFDCAPEIKGLLEELGVLEGRALEAKALFGALVRRSATVSNAQRALMVVCRGLAKGSIVKEAFSATRETVRDSVSTLWNTTGLCEGKVFKDWIEARIEEKTKIAHCTFGELRGLIESGRPLKHLHVFATCLGPPQEIARISSEDSEWDNVVISSSIRASMSIPGAFVPAILDIKVSGRISSWTARGVFGDGGMLNNCPVDAFDERQYVDVGAAQEARRLPVFNARTLALSLYSPGGDQVTQSEPNNLGELLMRIVGTYQHAEDLIRDRNPSNACRIINISNEGVGLLDFNLSPEKKALLVASGRSATRAFLRLEEDTPEEDSGGAAAAASAAGAAPDPRPVERPTFWPAASTGAATAGGDAPTNVPTAQASPLPPTTGGDNNEVRSNIGAGLGHAGAGVVLVGVGILSGGTVPLAAAAAGGVVQGVAASRNFMKAYWAAGDPAQSPHSGAPSSLDDSAGASGGAAAAAASPPPTYPDYKAFPTIYGYEKPPIAAQLLYSEGCQLAEQGNYQAAMHKYREALVKIKAHHGADHLNVGLCLMKLGDCQVKLNDPQGLLKMRRANTIILSHTSVLQNSRLVDSVLRFTDQLVDCVNPDAN